MINVTIVSVFAHVTIAVMLRSPVVSHLRLSPVVTSLLFAFGCATSATGFAAIALSAKQSVELRTNSFKNYDEP